MPRWATMKPMSFAVAPIDAAIELLACPVCRSAFNRFDRVLSCSAGHGFDLARQGYVNLLRGPAPGNADTTEMVAARDRFLDTGAYRPVQEVVTACCAGAARVVEVGAGTGYYLCAAVAAHHPRAHLALDVSIAAARRSARRGLASAVADTWAGLPVRSRAVDRLLCVFAPRNPEEFARVLAPEGRCIVITPSPRHLAALRRRFDLLDVPEDKLARLDESLRAAGLHLANRTHLEFEVTLSGQAVADLVGMGPNAFHRQPPAVDETLGALVSITISDFRNRSTSS